MSSPDEAHVWTEEKLKELEKRIADVYTQARDEENKSLEEYFAALKKEDEKMKALVEGGKMTEKKYQQWRKQEYLKGDLYTGMRDELAERMTHANEIAIAYVNDATPGIYSINRNWSSYKIESQVGDRNFTLFDERTVRRLIVDEPELMPNYPPNKVVKRNIDIEYGKKQITSTVTSGILQGKSIPEMAKDLQERIPEMNYNSAVRAARTAVTGAENAGRIDQYIAAKKMGIKLKKQWVSTLDGRTRHSHAELDGATIDTSKAFDNGCQYPGDPNGRPEEVYNCRCTISAILDDSPPQNAQRRARNGKSGRNYVIDYTTYQEWEKNKKQAAAAAKPKKQSEKVVDIIATPQKSSNQEYNELIEQIQNKQVTYIPVAMHDGERSEAEIISVISGGDLTDGSCASAAFAYVGQKCGMSVLDFRGGESRDYFSGKNNIRKIFKAFGAETIVEEKSISDLANAKRILARMEHGKEYYLVAGKHGAIVRLGENGKPEYLELQSGYPHNNTWHSLDSLEILKARFGCTTERSAHSAVFMADISQIRGGDDFRTLMGFINTPEGEQKKGEHGTTK